MKYLLYLVFDKYENPLYLLESQRFFNDECTVFSGETMRVRPSYDNSSNTIDIWKI